MLTFLLTGWRGNKAGKKKGRTFVLVKGKEGGAIFLMEIPKNALSMPL